MSSKTLIGIVIAFAITAICLGVVGLMQWSILNKVHDLSQGKQPSDVYTFLEELTKEKTIYFAPDRFTATEAEAYKARINEWIEELKRQNPGMKVPPMPEG